MSTKYMQTAIERCYIQGWPISEKIRVIFFTVILQRVISNTWGHIPLPFLFEGNIVLNPSEVDIYKKPILKYEQRSCIKPGKATHAAQEPWIGHSCSNRLQ